MNFGGEQAARTCAAADRTGHAILHSLYQQNIRARTHFFDEYFAIDLLRDRDGYVLGALVLEIATGEPLIIEAKTTLLATGGAGQLFRTNTNALINTGDGMAMALRAGIPLQDMEFFQFHPTGIAGKGMLITEGARGEGGYLVNGAGERFMERYAPQSQGSRQSRCGQPCHLYRSARRSRLRTATRIMRCSSRHLGADVVNKRLPGIRDMCLTFLHLDPIDAPIPVYPTAHYTMGGIPTNRYGQVVVPEQQGPEEPVPGLYAAGECACVSVHGANRLGGNSLLDILVFGRAAANHIIDYLSRTHYHRPMNHEQCRSCHGTRLAAGIAGWRWRNRRWPARRTKEGDGRLLWCVPYEEVLRQGLAKVTRHRRQRLQNAHIKDQSKIFNTARIEAMELENLVDIALATVARALARRESRGAHSRMDYPATRRRALDQAQPVSKETRQWISNPCASNR